MTPEIEKKRREVFEAFVVDFHRGASLYCERHSDPEYPDLNGQLIYEDWNVQSAWAVFNAALDAVEISHPGKFPAADSDGSIVWNKCCDVFTDAITATGLGLRIK